MKSKCFNQMKTANFDSQCFISSNSLHLIPIILLMSRSPQQSRISFEGDISQPPAEIFCSGFDERAWLKSRGKEDYISFSDKALIELRKYFNSLDQNNNGSIGVEELEDPFIAFGLSDNREEV